MFQSPVRGIQNCHYVVATYKPAAQTEDCNGFRLRRSCAAEPHRTAWRERAQLSDLIRCQQNEPWLAAVKLILHSARGDHFVTAFALSLWGKNG